MNVYVRLDEIPLMRLQDIQETLSMYKQFKPLRITKGNNSHRIDPKPLLFYYKYLSCIQYMNVYARFHEIPSMTFKDY